MLKRALVGIPAAVLMLSLAACGEEDDGGEATDTSTESSEASTEPSETATEASEETEETEAGGSCEYAPDGQPAEADAPPADPAVTGDVEVTFDTSIGEFHATLDGKGKPCTVGSFVSLTEQGFYDGTSCHRMTTTPNFEVLQCGDPTGTGSGGPGYTIPDELDGEETYPAGTLAMANTGMPDSGGSQFFIVYGDTALPPDYAVFGTVDQDTIDLIADAAKAGVTPQMGPEDGAPKTPIDFETVTVD